MTATELYRKYRTAFVLLTRIVDFMNFKDRTKEQIPLGSQILWLHREDGKVTLTIEDQ